MQKKLYVYVFNYNLKLHIINQITNKINITGLLFTMLFFIKN